MIGYLCLVLALMVSAHDFSVCKNHADNIGVNSLRFDPDPPKAGEDLTITLEGVTQVEIPQGTELSVEFKLYGVVVYSEKLPICGEGMLACPVASGSSYSASTSVSIPSSTPRHITAEVTATVVDNSGSELSCLKTSAEVKFEQDEEHYGLSSPPDHVMEFLFTRWKAMFPKMEAKFETFVENWKRIVKHNTDPEQTYTMAMNEFGCMTADEFAATRMGLRGTSLKERTKDHVVAPIRLRSEVSLADPPEELDWVEKGMVTPVKNQGSCGSCWAFSTVAALESAYAIQTGNLVEFSEQELVSCDTVDSACNGGLMDNAFDWIEHNTEGLCTEGDYPYTSGTTGARGQCMKSTCTPVPGSVPKSYLDIQPNEAALLAAVATHGPVSVAIEADQAAFQFYKSGVMTGQCGNHLDHGVLLVGYGVDQGIKFWKIKNSWGSNWGEGGYIRILRGKRWPAGGECGIAAAASYPVFASDEALAV